MRRKLLLLNLALALLAIYAGWQLHRERQAAAARAAAELGKRVPPAPQPPHSAMQTASPVVAGSYAEIVQKTLFDRSRNPTVEVVVPPPPPPKPVPPLPVYHGQMNLGGITVILSADANSPHQGLQIGESIGQFKLAGVNTEEIIFEWEGQSIRKKLTELMDHSGAPQQAAAPAAAAPTAARTDAPAPPPVTPTPQGPGQDMGAGFRACQANDSNPAGTVVDGYRKVIFVSPFGQSCRWDPVR